MGQLYQDAPEQPKQESVTPYVMGYDNSHSDLVRLSLNVDDLIDSIKIQLLSLEYDMESEKYIQPKDAQPLINQNGAHAVITILSCLVNRNTNLSNLDEEDIRIISKELELNVNDLFLRNWDKYWDDEWEAEKFWSTVRAIVGNMVFFCLKQAKGGQHINILGGNTKTLIQKSEVDSHQRIVQNPAKSNIMQGMQKIFR